MKFYLFADDTSLLYPNRDCKSLENTVNAEFFKLCDWLTAKRLTLNTKKPDIFRSHQRILSYQPKIWVFDIEVLLECKEYVKYLGTCSDRQKPNWREHIDIVESKICKTKGNILRLRHVVPFRSNFIASVPAFDLSLS